VTRNTAVGYALSVAILIGAAVNCPSSFSQDETIQASALGSTLTVHVSDRFAGAIDSLKYRGTQYINSDDHGREMQSASSFDNLGECFNPTEAGSQTDGSGRSSSSHLISISNVNGVLTTNTNMAFWLLPHQNYGAPCGSTAATVAQNSTILSGHLLQKTISIGYGSISNLMPYTVTFTVPDTHAQATFEALTGYMPLAFSTFLTYDRNNKVLRKLNATSVGLASRTPVILTTADGLNAMGVISPNTYKAGVTQPYYAVWSIPSGNTSKWNCVFSEQGISAGRKYTYSCYVAVGTVDEVVTAMNKYPSASTNLLVPVYRFLAAKHFITTSFTEGARNGYAFEETAFRVYALPTEPGTIPLYRCLVSTSGAHFLSISGNCEGQKPDGELGYIVSTARDGFVALRRFRNSGGDYLITTNPDEGTVNHYTYEETLGYVPL
jgi:hypothetical protein